MPEPSNARSAAQRARREREKIERRAAAAKAREAAKRMTVAEPRPVGRPRLDKRRKAALAREARCRAERARTNGVALGPVSGPSTDHNVHETIDHGVRGQTERPTRADPPVLSAGEASWRSPVYAAGSIHGPRYEKRGRRIPAPEPANIGWAWGDPCPNCGSATEFGYCSRCVWVCDNCARPKPEPIIGYWAAEASPRAA